MQILSISGPNIRGLHTKQALYNLEEFLPKLNRCFVVVLLQTSSSLLLNQTLLMAMVTRLFFSYSMNILTIGEVWTQQLSVITTVLSITEKIRDKEQHTTKKNFHNAAFPQSLLLGRRQVSYSHQTKISYLSYIAKAFMNSNRIVEKVTWNKQIGASSTESRNFDEIHTHYWREG